MTLAEHLRAIIVLIVKNPILVTAAECIIVSVLVIGFWFLIIKPIASFIYSKLIVLTYNIKVLDYDSANQLYTFTFRNKIMYQFYWDICTDKDNVHKSKITQLLTNQELKCIKKITSDYKYKQTIQEQEDKRKKIGLV